MSEVTPHSSIADLRAAYAAGDLSPSAVLAETLERVAAVNPIVNAIAEVDAESALAAAKASDHRWAGGRPLGPLDGIPVTVKDSVDAVGMTWRHGTAPNAGREPATVDAPPTARLREAGAVVFAKTTMPDLGMMAAGVSSLYGIVRNPWQLEANTGGSSAGAAAALAAGLAYGSVGTDIAGSVRLPAGHCGVTALKPTQGQVPHAPASTMRSAGPMARYAGDLVDLFGVLARPDFRDTLSLPAPTARSGPGDRTALTGLRVGLLTDIGYEVGPAGSRPDDAVLTVVRRAADVLSDLGAEIVETAPPFDSDAYAALDRAFAVRARAEILSFPDDDRPRVERRVAAWAESGDGLTATDYYADLAAVGASADAFTAHYSTVDLVLSSVIPVVSFPADRVGVFEAQPLRHCGFTCWFNQTGQPAGTLPFGWVDGHPVGVQIAGRRFADALVLDVIRQLEQHRDNTPTWPLLSAATRGANDG